MRARIPTRRAREHAQRTLRSMFAPSAIPLWIIGIAALSGILLFLAWGGLAAAQSTARQVAGDDEVRTSLYSVSVQSAEIVDEVEEAYITAEPGEDLLVLTLVLENLTDRPVGVLGAADGISSRLLGVRESLLQPSGVAALTDVRAWRGGSSASPVLQPGVPTKVQVAWPVPEGSFAEGTMRLDVYDARVRAGQIIVSSRDIAWRRTELAARITVEVDR